MLGLELECGVGYIKFGLTPFLNFGPLNRGSNSKIIRGYKKFEILKFELVEKLDHQIPDHFHGFIYCYQTTNTIEIRPSENIYDTSI